MEVRSKRMGQVLHHSNFNIIGVSPANGGIATLTANLPQAMNAVTKEPHREQARMKRRVTRGSAADAGPVIRCASYRLLAERERTLSW